MQEMRITFDLELTRQSVRLFPEERDEYFRMEFEGWRYADPTLDRQRKFPDLKCKLFICNKEALPAGWDGGGWFTKRTHEEWMLQHGANSLLGRMLIPNNLVPKFHGEDLLAGQPFEVSIFLPERVFSEVVAQARFRATNGFNTSACITVASATFPLMLTHLDAVDMSEHVEYPIVGVEFRDGKRKGACPPS